MGPPTSLETGRSGVESLRARAILVAVSYGFASHYCSIKGLLSNIFSTFKGRTALGLRL